MPRAGARARRVAIIGVGMSGPCMAARLKLAGIETFTVFEKGGPARRQVAGLARPLARGYCRSGPVAEREESICDVKSCRLSRRH